MRTEEDGTARFSLAVALIALILLTVFLGRVAVRLDDLTTRVEAIEAEGLP